MRSRLYAVPPLSSESGTYKSVKARGVGRGEDAVAVVEGVPARVLPPHPGSRRRRAPLWGEKGGMN